MYVVDATRNDIVSFKGNIIFTASYVAIVLCNQLCG